MNNRQFDSNNKSIDSFFKKIGLGAAVRPDQFWKNIDKKYGKLAREFGDCVELREKGEVADPYPLKNQSIEFANAIATQFDISKIKSFLLKFINIGFELEGSRVLEIGCDNGILLCYLALTYPNTSFIGIDPCTQAIELANHRAKSLNLNNVTFKSVSIDTFANISKDEKLDLIISIAVFHEILGTNEFNILKELTDNFSIEGVDNHFKEFCIEIDDLKQIFTLLNEDGIFLSADRWGHPTTLLRWIRLNEKIGLNCLLPHCDMLEYTVPMAGTQIMPLTFFNKSKVRPLLACDILSLKAFPYFVKQKHLHLIDDPLIAEMIYGSLIKEEIYSHEATYRNGSGVLCINMGVANGLAYVYTFSSTGFRQLFLAPSAVIYEKLHEMKAAREELEEYADIKFLLGNPDLFLRLGLDVNEVN